MSGRLYLRTCSDVQGKHCGKAFRSTNKRALLCPSCRAERAEERKAKELAEREERDALKHAQEAAEKARIEEVEMEEANRSYEARRTAFDLLRGRFIWGMS